MRRPDSGAGDLDHGSSRHSTSRGSGPGASCSRSPSAELGFSVAEATSLLNEQRGWASTAKTCPCWWTAPRAGRPASTWPHCRCEDAMTPHDFIDRVRRGRPQRRRLPDHGGPERAVRRRPRLPAGHIGARETVPVAVRRGDGREAGPASSCGRWRTPTRSSSPSTTSGSGTATTTCSGTSCATSCSSPTRTGRSRPTAARRDWLHEHGDTSEAILHTIAAGDIAEAVEMVAASWRPLSYVGRHLRG